MYVSKSAKRCPRVSELGHFRLAVSRPSIWPPCLVFSEFPFQHKLRYFFGATCWKGKFEKTKHGQMLGRETASRKCPNTDTRGTEFNNFDYWYTRNMKKKENIALPSCASHYLCLPVQVFGSHMGVFFFWTTFYLPCSGGPPSGFGLMPFFSIFLSSDALIQEMMPKAANLGQIAKKWKELDLSQTKVK